MKILLSLTSLLLSVLWCYPQSGINSKYFTTSDEVELHYLECGSGPTLVFVPGGTVPTWMWKAQIEYFADDYHVVALDPRGQGQSGKPSFGYYYERKALDIWELLDHLNPEPVILIGWSIGVHEILLGTQEYGTEKIAKLVLVDHSLNYSDEVIERIARNRVEAYQLDRENFTREFMKALHKSPQSEAYFDRLVEDVMAMPTNAATIQIANWYFLADTDLRPLVDALDRPALFIYSSLDWAVESAKEVRERWPNIPVEIIEDTSHAVFVDKPDEFNQILESFITTP